MKAIIFDFDGVIGDTKNLNFLIARKNNPNLSIKEFEDHHNGNVIEEPLFKVLDNFFEIQKEMFTKDNLFPVLDEIKNLSEKYLLFLVSSGKEDNIFHFLKLGNIDTCFKEILGKEFSSSKVKKFQYLTTKYNLLVDDCLFVTDTIGDIKEANLAGVKTVAVSWGYHSEDLLKTGKPFKIIYNFSELNSL